MMKFTKKRISTIIEEIYPKIGIICSINQLEHTNVNSETYKIITNKGKFVFHHNNFDKKRRIEKMCEILNKVSTNYSKIVQPIKTKEGDFSKNNCYLTKYEEGKKFSGSKKEFFNLAKNLSKLHKKFNENDFNYLFRPNQQNYKLLNLNEILIIEQKLLKIKDFTKNENIVKQNLKIIKIEIEQNLLFTNKIISQKQLIHFDLHPENLLFKNGDVKLFLDFNSMRMSYPMEDIIFSSFRFACKISQNPKVIRELIISFFTKYSNRKIFYNKSELNFLLIRCILYRICFILRKYFFQFSTLWISDLQSQLNYLKLAKKIFN